MITTSFVLIFLCTFLLFYFVLLSLLIPFFFFFNDTATTEIYTLSLHDALPISRDPYADPHDHKGKSLVADLRAFEKLPRQDRKSTRLNSSHQIISYAVFCLKKKNNKKKPPETTNQRNSNEATRAEHYSETKTCG